MILEVGKHYVNKTWKYLVPVILGHESIFREKHNMFFKFAYGVHDCLLDGIPKFAGKNLFILFGTDLKPREFQLFLEWLRTRSYYVHDYCPDPNINSKRHMVVIRIPERFHHAYDCFIRGEYHSMYSPEEQKILFASPERQYYAREMNQDPSLISEFIKTLNREFNKVSGLKKTDFENSELILPPTWKEEVFNAKVIYKPPLEEGFEPNEMQFIEPELFYKYGMDSNRLRQPTI